MLGKRYRKSARFARQPGQEFVEPPIDLGDHLRVSASARSLEVGE